MAPVIPAPAQTKDHALKDVKITLYWLEQSRAHRILWLLEELQLEYELKTYKRQNMLAPVELKEIHPLGKSPLITIEKRSTGETVTLAESSNMIEYLLANFGNGRLVPQQYQSGKENDIFGETESWRRYRYLMHYVEGTLMPLLVTALLLKAMRDNSPFFIRPVISMVTGMVESRFLNPNLKANMDLLESMLSSSPGKGQWICGTELTGADVNLCFAIHAGRERAGITQENYPLLYEYGQRIKETPSYKRAVQKIKEVEGKFEANL